MRWGGRDLRKWQPTFALLPKQCICGTWVWLEPLEATGYCENPEVPIRAIYHVGFFGPSLAYRLPKEPA